MPRSRHQPGPAGLEPSLENEPSLIISCVALGCGSGFLVFSFPFFDKLTLDCYLIELCFRALGGTWNRHPRSTGFN